MEYRLTSFLKRDGTIISDSFLSGAEHYEHNSFLRGKGDGKRGKGEGGRGNPIGRPGKKKREASRTFFFFGRLQWVI